MKSLTISQLAKATQVNVARAVATWTVPTGMTSHVHAFDARIWEVAHGA